MRDLERMRKESVRLEWKRGEIKESVYFFDLFVIMYDMNENMDEYGKKH